MAAVTGTIQSVSLIDGPNAGLGNVKKYRCMVDFAIYTTGDIGTITGVTTTIQNQTKSGKTVSLLGATGGNPGKTAAGVAVYAREIFTVSGATIQCQLGTVSAEATSAASEGVELTVIASES